MTIAAELARQTKRIERIMVQGSFVDEVPLKIHERQMDRGGVHEWHPAFISYLRSAGVCFCEIDDPEWIARFGANAHLCDRRPASGKFRSPTYHMHPHRLKRALRKLRGLDKAAFEACYPVLARGLTWEQCRARIDTTRIARGEAALLDIEWAALVISGLSLLEASY